MVHCLSGLHVLTLVIGYLVFTKISTSVRRCSILYRTRAAFPDDAEVLKPMTDGSEDSYREALEIWAE